MLGLGPVKKTNRFYCLTKVLLNGKKSNPQPDWNRLYLRFYIKYHICLHRVIRRQPMVYYWGYYIIGVPDMAE